MTARTPGSVLRGRATSLLPAIRFGRKNVKWEEQ